jgi:hypothetical protein
MTYKSIRSQVRATLIEGILTEYVITLFKAQTAHSNNF